MDERELIVDAFVLRARRVMAHSLLRSEESAQVLVEQARGQEEWTLFPATSEVERVERVPDEEALESLAARVRPFLLERDPVQYNRVLNELARQIREHHLDEELQTVGTLREAWKGADPQVAGSRFTYQVAHLTGVEAAAESEDVELSLAWFYADLVHANRGEHGNALRFDLTRRYRSAVPTVARLALAANMTLHHVLRWHEVGALTISEAALNEAVAVTETEFRERGQGLVAEVGTRPPAITDAFGDEWQPISTIVEELLTSHSPHLDEANPS